MLPQPSATWSVCRTTITAGKSIGAGNEAATCATGWTTRERRGERPTAIPAGSAQSVPSTVATATRPSVRRPHLEEVHPRRGSHRAEEQDELVAPEGEDQDEGGEEEARRGGRDGFGARARHGARGARRGAAGPVGEAAEEGEHARAADEVVEPGGHRLLLAALLDAELLRPHHERAPEELVEDDDHQHHGGDGPEHGAGGRREPTATRHVRAEAGEAEVLVAEDEGLADHQEEPAARHAHHAVPHEARGGEGQLDLAQDAPPAEAVERWPPRSARGGPRAASGRS